MTAPALRPPLRYAVPAVALGGAVGALARHAVDVGAGQTVFPWPTLAINVVGAALLALLPALPAVRRRPVLAAGLGAGVLGGFTTMSAYAEQARVLVAAGHAGLAAAYVVGSVGAAVGAVLVVRRLTLRVEP